MCKDSVSRLFVEYFCDGECYDFHAKLGTESQRMSLEKKYPDCENIADSCGDYNSEMIYGDNDTLKILVSCADNDEMNYFQFAVKFMTELIEAQAPLKLNKANDFAFLCMEYD